jgi:hypothetical protein
MKKEVLIILDLAKQYLNPTYDIHAGGGIKQQKEHEEATFTQVVAEVAKRDQNVLKIWNVVKKAKKDD